MATIKIDSALIQEHMDEEGEVTITSFEWVAGRNDIDVEYDIDIDADLEYEDEDYVDVEEYNIVVIERDQLAIDLEDMTMKYNKAVLDYKELVNSLNKAAQPTKTFKLFGIFGK